jgi:hypothetical protein
MEAPGKEAAYCIPCSMGVFREISVPVEYGRMLPSPLQLESGCSLLEVSEESSHGGLDGDILRA